MNSITERYFIRAGAQEKIQCMAGAEERVSNGAFEHGTPGSPAGPSLLNPSSCINYCSLADSGLLCSQGKWGRQCTAWVDS